MEQTINSTYELRTLSNQMADAVERASKALVLVNGRDRQPASGVVYKDNLIVTANHVLNRTENITIQAHDGRTLPAKLLGRDATTDLAVLQVADLGITAATPATEQVRVGQLVIAVGRTTDEGPMASSGIVSTIGGPLRTSRGNVLERYIRTDAIPYPGFSGGPLVNTQGQVVGILTTGLANGVTLAIPLDIANGIADTLATQGSIKRGYLGISSQWVELPAAQRTGHNQEHGLLLIKVDENSPAHQGNLMVGDILLTLDGHAINDAEDLQTLLVGDRVGKTIPIEVLRGNTLHTLQVTIRERN